MILRIEEQLVEMKPSMSSITWMGRNFHDNTFSAWMFVEGEGSLFVLVAKRRDVVTAWDVVRYGTNVVYRSSIHHRWDILKRKQSTFRFLMWNPVSSKFMLFYCTERSVLVHSLQVPSVICLFSKSTEKEVLVTLCSCIIPFHSLEHEQQWREEMMSQWRIR